MTAGVKRVLLAALCARGRALGAAAPAHAAFDDPLFVFRPVPPPPPTFPPLPPPSDHLEGPCGLALDSNGNIYVSDYYHHAVDVFVPNPPSGYNWGYITQISGEDPLDGPCGLALDAGNNLYVNNYHRNVVKFGPSPAFGSGTVIAGVGAEVEPAYPTGVAVSPGDGNVYVDSRTHFEIRLPNGTGVGAIGFGTLEDGYGIAVSGFVATKGYVYVPDAGDNTVKVYDPATISGPSGPPVATIDGAGTPAGHFTSLRNSAIAVDNETGEIYVVDDLTPRYTSHHEGVVYVFSAVGAYEGRLKYSVDLALPAGLAVDNSAGSTKGRVYVTSGNTERAAVYAYPPHAATNAAVPLSSFGPVGGGSGGGSDAAAAPPDLPLTASGNVAVPAAAAVAAAPTTAAAVRRHRPKAPHGKAQKRHRAHHRHSSRRAPR
jgi:hypothetical protein